MKKAFLLSFTLLILTGSTSKKSYLDYFDQLLQIEQHIAKEKFTEALKGYRQLFTKYKKVFARDAYNACQIAAIANDPSFDEFYGWCCRSGVSRWALKKNYYIFGKMKADTFAYGVVHSKAMAEYYRTIDTALRREFMGRVKKELSLRGKEGFREACSDNFKRLQELCAQNQFPGEISIGVDDQLESLILPTLLHYPYSYTALKPCLEKAVSEGALNPMQLVNIYCHNQVRHSPLYDTYKDTINFKTIYNLQVGEKSLDIVAVNKARKEKRILSYDTEIGLRNVMAKYGLNYKSGI